MFLMVPHLKSFPSFEPVIVLPLYAYEIPLTNPVVAWLNKTFTPL